MQTNQKNTKIKKTTIKLNRVLSSIAILTAAIVAVPVSAQSNYDQSNNAVTIYSDCGFRGRSQRVTPGDYRKMRGLGFENDSISSVRVPQGLELVIYEDHKFRGPYARINRDISCFDRQWDNQVSSLKVSGEAYGQRQGDRTQSRRGGDRGYDGRERDDRSRDVRGRDDRGNRGRGDRDNRDYESRNYDNRGRDNQISGACFNYKAYTLGGEGGVRFHGKEGFYRFSKKPHAARVCHSGDLTMEINKTSPATEVVIEIQGKQFRFAKNEKEDKYKNTWYRKLQTLVVGR